MPTLPTHELLTDLSAAMDILAGLGLLAALIAFAIFVACACTEWLWPEE